MKEYREWIRIDAKNLTKSRLRPVSPYSYVGQGRKGTKVKTGKPQMDQPSSCSRGTMAGKLRRAQSSRCGLTRIRDTGPQ